MLRPLTAQLVGSYTKLNWLIRHHNVTTPYGDAMFWRPESDVLEQAQDDASRPAIFDQERAGLDIITYGEQRRHRYDSVFPFKWYRYRKVGAMVYEGALYEFHRYG
jgi:5-methyltetrahydropteroyltriglutamate--homocysteine methyltransferase